MIRLRTPEQNKKFWIHFSRLSLHRGHRTQLALRFSGGRTGRTSELRYEEAEQLIAYLASQLPDLKTRSGRKADRMRKKILSIAYQLGWEDLHGKVDFLKLNRWLRQYGVHHKALNDLSERELVDTITQMEQLLKKDALDLDNG